MLSKQEYDVRKKTILLSIKNNILRFTRKRKENIL